MGRARLLRGANGLYEMHGRLADGGMATVHIGRAVSGAAAGRLLAIKQLGPELSSKPSFVAMFLDEARIAARIRHTNVVATLDVLENEGDLFQILEYVSGETLARVQRCALSAAPRSVAHRIVHRRRALARARWGAPHPSRRGELVHRAPRRLAAEHHHRRRRSWPGSSTSGGQVGGPRALTVNGEVKGKLDTSRRSSCRSETSPCAQTSTPWAWCSGGCSSGAAAPRRRADAVVREALAPSAAELGGLRPRPRSRRAHPRACAVDPRNASPRCGDGDAGGACSARVRSRGGALHGRRGRRRAGEALAAGAVRDTWKTTRTTTATGHHRPPPPTRSSARGAGAATRPFAPHSELDQDSLSLRRLTRGGATAGPRRRRQPARRGARLSVSALPPASAPRQRRGLASNVFYPVGLAPPGARRGTERRSSARGSPGRDGASTFPDARERHRRPRRWSSTNAREQRPGNAMATASRPAEARRGGSDAPARSRRRHGVDVALGRVAATVRWCGRRRLALALSFTVAPRAAAAGAADCLRVVGPYLRNARRLAGTPSADDVPAATAASGEPR